MKLARVICFARFAEADADADWKCKRIESVLMSAFVRERSSFAARVSTTTRHELRDYFEQSIRLTNTQVEDIQSRM